MGFTGIPRHLATWVGGLGLSPYMLLFALTIFYIFLGCFLDGVSMMVVSAAVVLPMVTNAGIDLLWFGIYVVIVVEMAQITPPGRFQSVRAAVHDRARHHAGHEGGNAVLLPDGAGDRDHSPRFRRS